MQWTDDLIVLRTGTFREIDLWVRALTRSRGLITAFAFGGRRSHRRFTGCLDAYNVIRATLSSSRDGRFLDMQEATLVRGPERLRRDWRRQGAAANCLRFLEAMGVPPDNARSGFDLLADLLALMDGEAPVPAVVPVLFRFRLAAEQGYAPDLSMCGRCGRALSACAHVHFLVGEGVLCCPECHRSGDMSLALGHEALDVLAKVKEYSPGSWNVLNPSAESVRQVSRIIDAFVRYHLGLEWVNGRFKAM